MMQSADIFRKPAQQKSKIIRQNTAKKVNTLDKKDKYTVSINVMYKNDVLVHI